MPTTQPTDEIKALLSQGRTEDAADYLLAMANDSKKPYYHSALLLKNRIESLQQQAIEGVLSQAEQNLEWARITKSILDLTEQIERNELPLSPGQLAEAGGRRRLPMLAKVLLALIPLLGLLAWLVFPKSPDATNTNDEQIAKTITYQGQVIRASDRSPVAGALLDINHGELKVETNADGAYEIALPADYDDIYLEIYFQGELKVNRRVIVSREVLQELKIPK
ncbi:MAG: hypothetical protein KDC66_22080 [Phaeodactylibacter sp.]|nr:hypothetical protein [Phaeodactylibacter sp.]MCB9273024.1 hypothetical protein [Lewinellaceae bacterium]